MLQTTIFTAKINVDNYDAKVSNTISISEFDGILMINTTIDND